MTEKGDQKKPLNSHSREGNDTETVPFHEVAKHLLGTPPKPRTKKKKKKKGKE